MPDAYLVVEMKITDPERYKQYMAAAPASLAAFGGEYVVRGGPLQALEGDWNPARLAVVRFPSMDQARAWYASELYQAARDRRAGTTEYFNMVLVEGMPRP